MTWKNLFWTGKKKNFILMGIGMIADFLVLPFLFLNQIGQWKAENEGALSPQIIGLYDFTYFNSDIAIVCTFLAVLNGIVLFSYLFSRKRQEFYFELPVKRKTLFYVQVLQGILIYVIPLVFHGIILLVLAFFYHVLSRTLVCILLEFTFYLLLQYLAIFAATVLVTMLSGTVFGSVIGTGTVLFYFLLMGASLNVLYYEELEDGGMLMSHVQDLSPFIIWDKVYEIMDEYYLSYNSDCIFLTSVPNGIKLLVVLGIIGIVFLAAARMIFAKRHIGDAGKCFIFRGTKETVKIAIITLLALAIYTFGEDQRMDIIRFIGYHNYIRSAILFKIIMVMIVVIPELIGMILGIFIVDLLLELTPKGMFRRWKNQLITIVISGALVWGLKWQRDFLAYDGFQNIPEDYSLEEAEEEGYVIKEGSKLAGGKNTWDAFYEKVSKGQNAKVRIAFESDWYRLDFIDLVYKNGKFTEYCSFDHFGKRKMKYLLKLKDTRNNHGGVSYYTFTNDKNLKSEDLEQEEVLATEYTDFSFEMLDGEGTPEYMVFLEVKE